MNVMRISEVARRSGVPATTLRYYDEIGLFPPASRSDNGYREYVERDIERLAFISRAKQLDLSLDDVAELLAAWDKDACTDVHDRVLAVVADRAAQTQKRIASLVTLSHELGSAADQLARASINDGKCTSTCACMLDAADAPILVPVACSLDSDEVDDRLAQWRRVAAQATRQAMTDAGIVLSFPFDTLVVGEIARLAGAEFECCSFLRFHLAIDIDGVQLTVSAPAEAQTVLVEMFGLLAGGETTAAPTEARQR